MAVQHRLLACVAVLAASVLLAACGEQPQQGAAASDAPVPSVVVAPVVSAPVSFAVEFVGQTQAVQKVDLRARVTGFLRKRGFQEGGTVAEGDVLFAIDQAEYAAARDAAAARLARAEATLLEDNQNLERYRILAERGTASEARLDEAIAKQGQSNADMTAARADLARADLDLGYTNIVSPVSGHIGRSSVDVGNLIGPDTGVLATVVTLDPIQVVFSVSERDFLNFKEAVRDGTARTFAPYVRLSNDALYAHRGKLDFIDVQVDPSVGAIQARAQFPNPDGLLLPGQFVSVILEGAEPEMQIVVPQAAVQANQIGPFVMVIDADNQLELRQIRTGQRSGTWIVVTDGLEVGETIVVEGIQKVRPGATVNPVQQASTQAGAPVQ
jgi:membrane fusion protein, multidrug efflux system